MPVTDGVFVANVPLVAAERVVRWEAVNRHVLVQRAELERRTLPIARRLGFSLGSGLLPVRLRAELEAALVAGLMRTFTFGRDEARRELAALRAREAAPAPALAAERSAADPDNARRRFDRLATQAAGEVEKAAGKAAGEGPVAASGAAMKALHLSVLESIGQALNLGRTAGAMTAPGGPPTYALRSEQLDRNSCEECVRVHGTILMVDSPEFYEGLPPAGCQGGGRCRGVVVFSDLIETAAERTV